ncbi:TPA: glycosyltransferase [Streptococcus suis]|nr:glycosyltransferase [Streptococcus suis]
MTFEDKPKISVVIIIDSDDYDTDRCLNSVLDQDYPFLEVIVLSNSFEVLKQFSEYYKDSSCSVVYVKHNDDVLVSRQRAVGISTGEYIYFIDSRDYLAGRSSLSDMMRVLLEYQSDFMISSFVSLLEKDGQFRFHTDNTIRELNSMNRWLFIKNNRELRVLWNKLIKTELLKEKSKNFWEMEEQRIIWTLIEESGKTIFQRSPHYVYLRDRHHIPEFQLLEIRENDLMDLPVVNKTKSKNISLAVCIDNNYCNYLKTLLYSIDKSQSSKVDVYVVYRNLSYQNVSSLKKFCEYLKAVNIFFVEVPKDIETRLAKISTENILLPLETYLRLLLPLLLPHLDRIIYIDTDILVVNSLEELWNFDLRGACLGAIKDRAFILRKNSWPYYFLPQNAENYFNAGVLLLDLEILRQHSVMERVIEFSIWNAENLLMADQDALNYCLGNSVSYLDDRYNYVVQNFTSSPRSVEEVTLIHYCGYHDPKPWKNISHIPFEQKSAVFLYRRYEREVFELLHKEAEVVSIYILANKNHDELLNTLETIFLLSYKKINIYIVSNSLPDSLEKELLLIQEYLGRLTINESDCDSIEKLIQIVSSKDQHEIMLYMESGDLLTEEELQRKIVDY